jgi:hypothetical protein
MDTQTMPAPVAAEQSLLTQGDVLNLLVKLAEHLEHLVKLPENAEEKFEKFTKLLAELRDYHSDARGRNIEALHQDINIYVFVPARAALDGHKGLNKLSGYWAARLLRELAKPLEQLDVAEVRRLARLLFEPHTGELRWDA